MTRPGPKPFPGARHPSGDLKRAARYAGSPPTELKRIVEAARRCANDPRLGTMIGRLYLEGVLLATQFGAAEAYGRLRGRHDKAMGLPRRSASSVLYDLGAGSPSRELDEKEIGKLRADHDALLREVGPLRPMLDRIVLDDEAPIPGDLPRLKAGLDAVAGLFGSGRGSNVRF